jgi:hypothetical protein
MFQQTQKERATKQTRKISTQHSAFMKQNTINEQRLTGSK